MKTTRIVLTVILAAAGLASLRAETNRDAAERKIELALYNGDTVALAAAERAIDEALAANPKAPAWQYLRGFASYAKTVVHYRTGDKKALRDQLELAEKQLQRVKGQPWEAEANGLRGMILGQLISVRGGAAAMTLGPKMSQLTSTAAEELPTSGRLRLFHGITLLNMPAAFGGDKAEALRRFEAAVQHFERAPSEPTNAASPKWGHAFALGWLSQAKLQVGDLTGAREAAERALVLEPRYGRATALLATIRKKTEAAEQPSRSAGEKSP